VGPPPRPPLMHPFNLLLGARRPLAGPTSLPPHSACQLRGRSPLFGPRRSTPASDCTFWNVCLFIFMRLLPRCYFDDSVSKEPRFCPPPGRLTPCWTSGPLWTCRRAPRWASGSGPSRWSATRTASCRPASPRWTSWPRSPRSGFWVLSKLSIRVMENLEKSWNFFIGYFQACKSPGGKM